jgi:hypothetical protein
MSKIKFLDDMKLVHIKNNVFLSSLMEMNSFRPSINKIVLTEVFDDDFYQPKSDLKGDIGRITLKIYDISEYSFNHQNEPYLKSRMFYNVMFEAENNNFDVNYNFRHILPYYYIDKSNDSEVMETAIHIANEILNN